MKQVRITSDGPVSVYNASAMTYSFLVVVMCYLTVLLPLELDSDMFSFVISTKYNLLKLHVTGFCFVFLRYVHCSVSNTG